MSKGGAERVFAGASGTVQTAIRARSLVRATALGATTVALAASLLLGAPRSALADPPLTVEEAKSQVVQLETEAETLDQDSVAVKEKLDDGRAKLRVKQKDMKAQQSRVARMRQQVGQVALAQFQNRNLDTAAQLFFTEDTDGFLSQISTVEKVSENQNTALQDYQAEQGKLTELERSAALDVALLKQQDKELQRLRDASAAKITESKAVLAKLTAEERQRIADEEKKAREAAAKQAAAAAAAAAADSTSTDSTSTDSTSTDSTGTGSTGTGSSSTDSSSTDSSSTDSTGTDAAGTDAAGANGSTGTSVASSSGRGAQALAFAKAQLGKPYVFAAEGPSAYDCSGLTLAAWKSVGVSLPRISWDQYGVGRVIPISDLQPGDLVFFYSGRSHVGLYAGNGMVIHAPRPGKSVEYTKMSYMPVNGASRPG